MPEDFNKLIEKIYKKLENLASSNKDEIIQIKEEIDSIHESNSKIASLVEEIASKSSSLTSDITDTDESSIIKLQTFLTEMSYQVAAIKEDFDGTNETVRNLVQGKIEELVEYLKDSQEKLDNQVKTNLEDVKESFSNITESLTEKLTELEKSFKEYDENLNGNILEEITEIKTNTENLANGLDNIKNLQNLTLTNAEFEEYQEKTKEELFGKIKEIEDSIGTLEVIKENQNQNVTLLQEELTKICSLMSGKENIEALKTALVKQIGNNSKDSVKQTKFIIDEIKAHAEKVDNLNLVESINRIDVIYDNINIINNWISEFDKISETVTEINEKINTSLETVDIEDITDKVDIIYENITTLNNWAQKLDEIGEKVNYQGNKLDEIYNNVNNLSEWTDKIHDIKEKLDTLSDEFTIMTSATKDDTDDYIYTLLDIESDFAKLHCTLDDTSKLTVEDLQSIKEQFTSLNNEIESLNDDIASISKRTNKLILTSDDANKVFKGHVDEFHALIRRFGDKVNSFNPEKQFTLIDNKVNTIKKLVAGAISSGKSINEALMYLAEWIDGTDVSIEEIKEKLDSTNTTIEDVSKSKTDLIKTVFVELQNKITNQDTIVKGACAELQEKIIEQDQTIKTLTEKIEQMSETINELKETKSKDSETDIKAVLDFIATQVISANENSLNNKVLGQKIEIMEHQMGKFEKNLSKIVAYLDED